MSKHPLAATAEGMPAQTARDLLYGSEEDLVMVRDHALILNNALTIGRDGLSAEECNALGNLSGDLLAIGYRLADFHREMHDALNGRQSSDNATKPVEVKSRPDLDAAFANLAKIVGNLHWFMLEHMHRKTDAEGRTVYEIDAGNGDEFFSIIYVADHWSKRVAEEALS